jgi:exodeoxyribonuclease VII large subunit
MQTLLDHHEHVLELTAKGPLQHEPMRFLERAAQRVDEFEASLSEGVREQLQRMTDVLTSSHQVLTQHHPRVVITEAAHRLETQSALLRQTLEHRLRRMEDRLAGRADLLRNLGPDSVLSRGFSFTMTADGRSLKEASAVKPGDKLITRLHAGEVRSVVE